MADASDRDLLARLNALKQSHIDLDEKRISDVPSSSAAIETHPAAFTSDIVSRLKALSPSSSSRQPVKHGTPLDIPELQNDTNDKTVEELLAEIGPEDEAWTLGANDEQEIQNLLKQAKEMLPEDSQEECSHEDRNSSFQDLSSQLPQSTSIDVSVFAPEPEDPAKSFAEHVPTTSEDGEADELLRRISDEIEHEPQDLIPDPNLQSVPSRNKTPRSRTPDAEPPPYSPRPEPPSIPAEDTTSSLADDLASLSLPSVPTSLPAVPSTLPKSKQTQPSSAPQDEEEEDQYCVICFADPTVRCLGSGCDGDLYCNLCWNEGHRGEDVGREMRSHRALVLNKGDDEKKAKEEAAKKIALRRPKGRLLGA